jgi:hypothetical protein
LQAVLRAATASLTASYAPRATAARPRAAGGALSPRHDIHVELSSAGLRAQREMLATVIAFARRLEAGFSKRELDQPHEALDRLASNVGDAA